MRYYRDIDYFLFFEEFPHMGVYGAAVPNTDGTVNIYINTRYNKDIQARALRHELRHMVKGHLWDEHKSVTQKELEAEDGGDDGCAFGDNFSFVEWIPTERFVDLLSECPDGMIPCFYSIEAFRRYILQLKSHRSGR